MEGDLLLSAAYAAGFMFAALVGGAGYTELQRVRSSADIQEHIPGNKESWGRKGRGKRLAQEARVVAAYYLRNGMGVFNWAGQILLHSKRFERLFTQAAGMTQRRGWQASKESLASVFVCGVLVLSVTVLVVFGSWSAFVLSPGIALGVLAVAVQHCKAKEKEKLREQIPDAMRCMEASLHAGVSLPQAFAEVAAELSSPAKELFARVSQDLDLGYSMNEALVRFHGQTDLPELAFVAMALDVQYACGGSATPILQSAERAVSEGVELKRSLRVQTAQARLSAQIVCVMPFALMFVLSVVSPGFLAPFFSSAEGLVLLLAALAMQAAGVVLVRRGMEVGS